MSANEIPSSASQWVDGFQIPAGFSADAFRSAVQYKPRPDDVFLVTYPKCGTTWAQHTLTLIFRQGVPMESPSKMFAASPFLETTGAESAETMERPGVIKTHFPFHLTPWSENAKYIYVTRNPKDCCVSYYHHMKNIPLHGLTTDFNGFFEMFITGKIDYEDYFDHLLGWYEHRNDPNVLFITYEEMKQDPKVVVLKMASFIDDEKYAEPLRRDHERLQNVLQYSSFDHMKETVNKGMDEFFAMSEEEIMKTDLPDAMKTMFLKMSSEIRNKDNRSKSQSVNFVRKGITGDWRNHFTVEQSKRMDAKFFERTKGTEIEHWWKEYM